MLLHFHAGHLLHLGEQTAPLLAVLVLGELLGGDEPSSRGADLAQGVVPRRGLIPIVAEVRQAGRTGKRELDAAVLRIERFHQEERPVRVDVPRLILGVVAAGD